MANKKKANKKKAKKRDEMFADPEPIDDDNDPEVQREMFETYKYMKWTPKDIKDEEMSKKYAEFLKENP
ncbi:MAG TPA: hypothetical protein VMZ25_11120 [Terriglobales bacterium]|nr:hypothetical protein [Terriglobales bacterium]